MTRPTFPWSFPTRPPAATPAPAPNNTPVDMEPQDEPESVFCMCDIELTAAEMDSGKCAACGKRIV